MIYSVISFHRQAGQLFSGSGNLSKPPSQQPHNKGFTIVELLIVIVVIGILAAITIVAYNGVQTRARNATIQSDLNGAIKTLEIANVSFGTYPTSQVSANLKASSGTVYQYTYALGDNSYCLSATNGTTAYSARSGGGISSGSCATSSSLGWWPLNGSANDQSNNGNNGAISGATTAFGQNGQPNSAYLFNGSSYIQLPSAVDVQQPITLSAWIYPTNFGSNEGTFVIAADPGPRILISPTGTPLANVATTAGWESPQYGNTILLNQWTYVTYVINGASQKLFVNGNLVSSGTIVGSTINYNASTPLVIGSDNFSGNYHEGFIGSLDDTRVYNRALSYAEVQSLYNAGAQ
jgi:prepilin-type N-terminal cleavage/methylation domain-containing protein